ncbi:MAG TPA: hypothetical protein PKC54_04990 [Ferruginibacter sp.]|nr:hypothetical protein [Ferruginibacter sp.]
MRHFGPNRPIKERKQWLDLSRGLSILAILISGYSIYISTRQYSEDKESRYIQNTYTTFFAVDRLNIENPKASHLFCLPRDYSIVDSLVHNAFLKDTTNSIEEAILKERSLAMHIFDYYEEITFKIRQAQNFDDDSQARFLNDELDYFIRILQNPRLLYYWTKMHFYYDERTVTHYNDSILQSRRFPLTFAMDSIGPYVK